MTGVNEIRSTFVEYFEKNGHRHVESSSLVPRNDLDNVGYTARRHTFFEMLGNFSFGDYFKEQAIKLAWNLVTKEFGLKKNKLLITVYSEDEEAASLWRKIAGFPDS